MATAQLTVRRVRVVGRVVDGPDPVQYEIVMNEAAMQIVWRTLRRRGTIIPETREELACQQFAEAIASSHVDDSQHVATAEVSDAV